MKAFITTPAELAAGIRSQTITIDGLPEPSDEQDRKDIRNSLKDFFTTFLDFPCGVSFDNECPSCGSLLSSNVCPNKFCIENISECSLP
jgi:hypothetical protein